MSVLKVGDVIFDTTLKKPGIITQEHVWYVDNDGMLSSWDFEILSDGSMYYADADELLPADKI